MMNRVTLALLLGVLAAPVRAQPPVLPVAPFEIKADYVSGQPGVPHRIEAGVIVLNAASLVYVELHEARRVGTIRSRGGRREWFTIPLATITTATHTIDTNGPKGAAVHEYVFVTTETETSTDVVIFQVKKNTSAATAAKITFAAKHAKADLQ
jgi:hypothetical protein